MSESDLIGTTSSGKRRWSGSDYLVAAGIGALLVAVVGAIAYRSEHGGAGAIVLGIGGALVVTWWLIGCAALGARVALRERDARD